MTAEPVPEYTPEPDPAPDAPAPQPVPDWLIPPPQGFVAEDLDHIPQLPAHTELIDGNLVFVSPQRNFHLLTMDVLVNGLRKTAPEHLRVRREMTVTLARRQRPEPDVLVLRAEAIRGPDQSDFRPEDVVLVVEVVSPESAIRDRERKPQLYAQAGIPNFWLVENTGGQAMVCVHALDTMTRQYVPTGVHHNRLKLTVPFEIDIDLTETTRL